MYYSEYSTLRKLFNYGQGFDGKFEGGCQAVDLLELAIPNHLSLMGVKAIVMIETTHLALKRRGGGWFVDALDMPAGFEFGDDAGKFGVMIEGH